ncbi:MAG: CoA transferase, partial [Myxococcales bacterium]
MVSSSESGRKGSVRAGALAGRRVVELADEKGLYCGKLLADMGADVVKVERPGGDRTRDLRPHRTAETGPDRSLPFLYLNTSKRSVTLDLEEAADRERFAGLAAGADLVLETCAPGRLDGLGLGYDALSAANAKIVVTSITDFGSTGPRAHWRGSDLVDSALGGAMYVTGYPEDPPVTMAGVQAYVATGTCAAAASVIAMFDATRSGRGQHVDIAVTEVVASVAHICGAGKYSSDGIVPKRFGTGLFASVPSGAYACKDGIIYLMVNRPAHWHALAGWINEVTGNREVLDPMFDGPSSVRQPYRELLDLFISEVTATMTVDETYREAQRRHIAITPVNTALGVTGDEHLDVRGFFVDVSHADGVTLRYPGPPFRPALTPWSIRRRAPLPGEHDDE